MYDRDLCAEHLQKKHAIPLDSSLSEETMEAMHMGRQGNYHFWCGFCNELVALSQDDCIEHGAWELRFRHIGEHFDKKGKDIGEWVCVEANLPLKLVREFARSEGNLRRESVSGRNGGVGEEEEEEEEDSDLGDDGMGSAPFVSSSTHGPLEPLSMSMSMSEDSDDDDDDDDVEGVSIGAAFGV